MAEIIGATVVFTIGAAASVYFLSSVFQTGAEVQTQSQVAAEQTFQQDLVSKGLNPNAVTPLEGVHVTGQTETRAVTDIGDASTALAGAASVSAIGVQSGSDRSAGFGYQVRASSSGVVAGSTELQLPDIFLSLATPFPVGFANVSASLSPAGGNPVGTVYRYTTDGSEPVSGSSLWDDPVYTAATFPAQIRVKPFHVDPQYTTPMATRDVMLTALLGVAFARESGVSRSFTYGEVTGDHDMDGTVDGPLNRGVLSLTAASSGTISYRLNGGAWMAYSGAFVPTLVTWAAGGGSVSLEFVAVPTDSRYVASAASSEVLSSVRAALPVPAVAISGPAVPAVGNFVVTPPTRRDLGGSSVVQTVSRTETAQYPPGYNPPSVSTTSTSFPIPPLN